VSESEGKTVDVAWIYARLIRALRLENALSQRRFAQMMEMSQSSLSHLEAGRQGPTLHHLLRAERLFAEELIPQFSGGDEPSEIERAGWLTMLGLRVAGRLSRHGVRVEYRSLRASEEALEIGRIDDEIDKVIDRMG
jgi:transcriptional regulator with XRE-family HTH domain